MAQYLLAVDAGGTKTNLAIFDRDRGLFDPVKEATFVSAHYKSLELLLKDFLQRNQEIKIDIAAIGLAGPVIGGRAKITNLDWVVDANELQQQLGLKFLSVVNDLVATARSLPFLRSEDIYTIKKGVPNKEGAMAVIAPGTGLGEAFLIWDGKRYQAIASEGGHVDFAPLDELQAEIWKILRHRFGHLSYERICSGSGLPNIYESLLALGHGSELPDIRKEIDAGNDPTPLIINRALQERNACPLCTKTLEIFVSILGAAAGNLALTVLATGGVFLGGGIPPKIIKALKTGPFVSAFCNKGRIASVLDHMPVRVILNPKAALLGAAGYAFDEEGAGE